MERIDPQELIEFLFSVKSYMGTNTADPGYYQEAIKRDCPLFEAGYLFSLPTWDVFELLNEDAVLAFTDKLDRQSINLQDKGLKSKPAPPVIRYLLLVPGSPEAQDQQEALKLLGQPFIDRLIILTVVLVDNEIYIPAGAHMMGVKPSDSDKRGAKLAAKLAAEGLSKEQKGNIVPAPDLPVKLLHFMEVFKTQELDSHSKYAFIEMMMGLGDLQFMEAVGRILPYAWKINEWFATEPQMAKRLHEYKESHPKLHGKMRQLPYKTAILHPAPYEPTIQFESANPSGYRTIIQKESLI